MYCIIFICRLESRRVNPVRVNTAHRRSKALELFQALNLSGTKDSESGFKALVLEYLYESHCFRRGFIRCHVRLFFA